MIYIHELKSLNPKSADIESVPIIRVIRESCRLPLSEESVRNIFSPFRIDEPEIGMMEKNVELTALAMEEIMGFYKLSRNSEPINLKRVYTDLNEIQHRMKINIEFARKIIGWQDDSMQQIALLINKAPSLKTREDRMNYQKEISPLFEAVLRHDRFTFRFFDIINEAHTMRMKDLIEGMNEGIFFHKGIIEHLKNADFSTMRTMLPKEEISAADSIAAKIAEIKKCVDVCYDFNRRMVGFAVHLYSYIKWAGGI